MYTYTRKLRNRWRLFCFRGTVPACYYLAVFQKKTLASHLFTRHCWKRRGCSSKVHLWCSVTDGLCLKGRNAKRFKRTASLMTATSRKNILCGTLPLFKPNRPSAKRIHLSFSLSRFLSFFFFSFLKQDDALRNY